MPNPNNFLTYCKLVELENTYTMYDPRSYTETGLHTIFVRSDGLYYTILVTESDVIFLHQAMRGSPSHEAYKKHHSYVQLMDEARAFEPSIVEGDPDQLTIFSIEENK